MNERNALFNEIAHHATANSARVLSIDVFRGATIAAMLLVDGQGGSEIYSMFRHSGWNGLTFTDCIAPCFMWIVGVSLATSLNNRLSRGDHVGVILRHVFRRAVILFGIGVFLNLLIPSVTAIVRMNIPELDRLQLMGTLQRIAIAYLIASIIFLVTANPKTQIMLAFILLASYLAIFYVASAPGFSFGDFSESNNPVSHIDRRVLGRMSNLSHPFLNNIPASAMVLFGAVIGRFLRGDAPNTRKFKVIMIAGTLLLLGGQVFAHWIPLNFRLWTPPYFMMVGGIACLCFGLCYWALEIKGVRRGMKLFWVLGMNPITIWVLAVGLKDLLGAKGFASPEGKWRSVWAIAFENISIPKLPAEINSLIFALIFIGFFYGVAHFLYSRKIIIRV